ncbi:hypothetical protein [Saccharothrix xinjiangensis]|uniref:Uncharacterized protein n=1 Tax=Saccharothrix xinjiangensis TaxID=204798 RepID=A0ABV9Y2L6_9PSEU
MTGIAPPPQETARPLPAGLDAALADLAAAGNDVRHTAAVRVGAQCLEADLPHSAAHHLTRAHRLLDTGAHRAGAEHVECLLLLAQAHLDCGRHDSAEAALHQARALHLTHTGTTAFIDRRLRQVARERHRPCPDTDRFAHADRFPDSADDLFAPLPTAQGLLPDTTTLQPMLDATAALAALDVAAAHSDLPGLADAVITRETRACAQVDGVHLDMWDVLTAYLPETAGTADKDTLRYLRAAQHLIPTTQTSDTALDADALARAAASLAGHPDHSLPFGPSTRRTLQQLTTWVDEAGDIPAVCRLAVAYRRLHTIPLPAPVAAPLARLYLTAAATRLAGPTGHRPPLSTWIATCAPDHHRLLATATDRDFTAHLATAITHTCQAESDLVDRLAVIATDLTGAHTSYDTTTHHLLRSIPTLPVITSTTVAARRATTTRAAIDFITRLTARGLIQRVDGSDTRPPGGRRYTHTEALALLTAPHPGSPCHTPPADASRSSVPPTSDDPPSAHQEQPR